MAANIGELIMPHDHERQFLQTKEEVHFERKTVVVPYYGHQAMPHDDRCIENNGNCSQKCETVEHETVCSCYEGYTLTSPTVCTEISGCDFVLSGTSGEFTIRNSYCRWLIKAPKGHIVEITLHETTNYYEEDYMNYGADFGYIYNGDTTEASVIKRLYPSTEETVLRSSGENLLITSGEEWDSYSFTQRVSYVTGFKYLEIEAGEYDGHLTLPVSSLPVGEDCLSLTYSIPHGPLMVRLSDQLINPQFTFK
ncbi:bone morphogenetic protein 1-like, partial [Schistocerca serialis cubense]|uniref:bone morphogenetic protein 1-like n=1 Tax=Schistocerca serialis cubense TaxID=2023355 RepID=UPI00214ECC58